MTIVMRMQKFFRSAISKVLFLLLLASALKYFGLIESSKFFEVVGLYNNNNLYVALAIALVLYFWSLLPKYKYVGEKHHRLKKGTYVWPSRSITSQPLYGDKSNNIGVLVGVSPWTSEKGKVPVHGQDLKNIKRVYVPIILEEK